MRVDLVTHIREYKKLILEENYIFIINEMLDDLKETLLNESTSINANICILETFHNIKSSDNIIERLTNLEEILTEGSEISISNVKLSFLNKHEKIIQRDKKWLNTNKKKILELNYDEIELEVPSDYKVSFEQLLNRHGIFDKIFTTVEDDSQLSDKLRRFEDKHENLKNGLDNYFRTGTSRREIGLRKIGGEDARFAVESMIAFCESFLSGKPYLEEKMNNIIVAVNDASVKESLTPIETLKILLEDSMKEINDASKELKGTITNSKSPEEKNKVDDNTKNKKQEEPEEEIDEELNEEIDEEPGEEQPENEENASPQRGIQDRQIGVTVLLTVAEERYFDYIELLKGLVNE